MLDPTTETKRGNFGRYYPSSRALVLWDHGFEMCALVLHAWVGHGTMGLKCALVLHAWVGMGPWV